MIPKHRRRWLVADQLPLEWTATGWRHSSAPFLRLTRAMTRGVGIAQSGSDVRFRPNAVPSFSRVESGVANGVSPASEHCIASAKSRPWRERKTHSVFSTAVTGIRQRLRPLSLFWVVTGGQSYEKIRIERDHWLVCRQCLTSPAGTALWCSACVRKGCVASKPLFQSVFVQAATQFRHCGCSRQNECRARDAKPCEQGRDDDLAFAGECRFHDGLRW